MNCWRNIVESFSYFSDIFFPLSTILYVLSALFFFFFFFIPFISTFFIHNVWYFFFFYSTFLAVYTETLMLSIITTFFYIVNKSQLLLLYCLVPRAVLFSYFLGFDIRDAHSFGLDSLHQCYVASQYCGYIGK